MNVQVSEKKGMIFDIQHFCLDDGPGIRTTVFFKGCPLRCIWCHNPESYEAAPTISYVSSRCIGCGACVKACPRHAHTMEDGMHSFDRALCIRCGKCAEVCCYQALSVIGRKVTAEEIIKEVLKDVSYYKIDGKGGMTVSGGEPFTQPDFLVTILKEAKDKGINICVETSGYTSEEWILKTMPYIDLWLFDIKGSQNDYKDLTRKEPEKIYGNLELIVKSGADVTVRIPLVPEVNDTEEFFDEIAGIHKRFPEIQTFEIMPYHGMGSAKAEQGGIYQKLGKLPDADEEQKKVWLRCLRSKGIPAYMNYFEKR